MSRLQAYNKDHVFCGTVVHSTENASLEIGENAALGIKEGMVNEAHLFFLFLFLPFLLECGCKTMLFITQQYRSSLHIANSVAPDI